MSEPKIEIKLSPIADKHKEPSISIELQLQLQTSTFLQKKKKVHNQFEQIRKGTLADEDVQSGSLQLGNLQSEIQRAREKKRKEEKKKRRKARKVRENGGRWTESFVAKDRMSAINPTGKFTG
ncbi:hypothetical protein K0M31_012296 [Melipona bicolor]|uniref:Uncharacterized protein n=1 Tax=Melipona bicolor TaxID=60889 RepID=A0AA40FK66_9HYME|nr:hypothetical protein K0M31_012296 [Melipona bicolor]